MVWVISVLTLQGARHRMGPPNASCKNGVASPEYRVPDELLNEGERSMMLTTPIALLKQ